jgi:hypothetical protein
MAGFGIAPQFHIAANAPSESDAARLIVAIAGEAC